MAHVVWNFQEKNINLHLFHLPQYWYRNWMIQVVQQILKANIQCSRYLRKYMVMLCCYSVNWLIHHLCNAELCYRFHPIVEIYMTCWKENVYHRNVILYLNVYRLHIVDFFQLNIATQWYLNFVLKMQKHYWGRS